MEVCDGIGRIKKKTPYSKCPACHGEGCHVKNFSSGLGDDEEVKVTCNVCRGTGVISDSELKTY
jgi:DnaJ-class molecular chaperone